MKTNKLSKIFSRAKEIYQQEGLVTFLKRVFTDFENSKFYISEIVLEEVKGADFIPNIPNMIFKVVETTQQLDELLKEGFDLSLLNIDQAHYRLEKGAIVFFIFVERELAWKAWSAMSEEAKNTFNPQPYKVDFTNNETCNGDASTSPKYRRLGVYTYGFYKRRDYLMEKGIKKTRAISMVSNNSILKVYEPIGVRAICAKAHYLRIFGLQFWKETPVESIKNNN